MWKKGVFVGRCQHGRENRLGFWNWRGELLRFVGFSNEVLLFRDGKFQRRVNETSTGWFPAPFCLKIVIFRLTTILCGFENFGLTSHIHILPLSISTHVTPTYELQRVTYALPVPDSQSRERNTKVSLRQVIQTMSEVAIEWLSANKLGHLSKQFEARSVDLDELMEFGITDLQFGCLLYSYTQLCIPFA